MADFTTAMHADRNDDVSIMKDTNAHANTTAVDVKSMLFMLWNERKNIVKVKEITAIICNSLCNRSTAAEIEYYLPQLSHLMIHYDLIDDTMSMEKLLIGICQCSMHIALQLSFVFIAAIEDYQPELCNGTINAYADSKLFARASKLLQIVEKSIMFGTAYDHLSIASTTGTHTADDDELSQLYQRVQGIKQSLRDELALSSMPVINALYSGPMLIKRDTRKSIAHSKSWKMRHFVTTSTILYCYRNSTDIANRIAPVRTIPLHDCVIDELMRDKYAYCFDLFVKSSSHVYHLRLTNKDDYDRWIREIKSTITTYPTVPIALNTDTNTTTINAKDNINNIEYQLSKLTNLTSVQRKRFDFFLQQVKFSKHLTHICEKLRLLPRYLRKSVLVHEMSTMVIPPAVYLPLLSSTDAFEYVLCTATAQCRPFNTKARCPAMMVFETLQHPRNFDVASFLATELNAYDADSIVNISCLASIDGHDDDGDDVIVSSTPAQDSRVLYSKLPSTYKAINHWQLSSSAAMTSATTSVSDNSNDTAVSDTTQSNNESNNSNDNASTVNKKSGTSFYEISKAVKEASPYGCEVGWKLSGLIAKSNDDVRQEVFVMQLIKYFQKIFTEDNVPIWLHSYKILNVTKSTGLIELIPDARSLDELKKSEDYKGSLRNYMETTFHCVYRSDKTAGASVDIPDFDKSKALVAAIDAYVKSMAGYSIVTYLLAIKDRHNGNIMIDNSNHIIHIDFGFVFGLAPGKAFSMETSPWKLTAEMVDAMYGTSSVFFKAYVSACTSALLTARKHVDSISKLMEIMTYKSGFPAFKYNKKSIDGFKARLHLDVPDSLLAAKVRQLVNSSISNIGTGLYDKFQLATNGIAP